MMSMRYYVCSHVNQIFDASHEPSESEAFRRRTGKKWAEAMQMQNMRGIAGCHDVQVSAS